MNNRRRYIRKYMIGMLAAALAAAVTPAEALKAEDPENVSAQADPADADLSKITLISKNGAVPRYSTDKKTSWELEVTNTNEQGTPEVENIVIKPDLGDNVDNWPFETEQQEYTQIISKLTPGQTKDISFTFTQREDVPTARHTISFGIFVDGVKVNTQKLYVNTTAKAKEPEKDEDKKPDKDPAQNDQPEAGGFSNGEASYSDGGGGESSGNSSVPRVIVTGFSTSPAEVRAGQDFTLTVHLKNTSKSSRVQNMLFDLQAPTEGSDEQTMAPAFLPSSGSSSIYLEGMNAEGAADISINLNAKSDLLQKPYSIELAMKYEDGEGTQVEGSSSLSIPVKQDARFELSEFEINPANITVGEEANIMFNLYNLGRIKLYNVKAAFEGENIKREEVFVGNVESGASASVDAMLEGTKMSEGPAKVTMILSYEDEAGKVSQKKEEFEIEVTEPMQEDMGMMEEMPMEESKLPVIPIVIAVIAAAVIIAVIVIVKRNKKKRMKNEEEALLDELDGPSEDEWK